MTSISRITAQPARRAALGRAVRVLGVPTHAAAAPPRGRGPVAGSGTARRSDDTPRRLCAGPPAATVHVVGSATNSPFGGRQARCAARLGVRPRWRRSWNHHRAAPPAWASACTLSRSQQRRVLALRCRSRPNLFRAAARGECGDVTGRWLRTLYHGAARRAWPPVRACSKKALITSASLVRRAVKNSR
jgi:hypothetical protein